MIAYFPKYISSRAIFLYFVLLIVVSLAFAYPMYWYWWLFGAVEVAGFFYFSNVLSKGWGKIESKRFERNIFWASLGIRAFYVVFSYLFYLSMTGTPFEFSSADSLMYDSIGREGSEMLWHGNLNLNSLFLGLDLSDRGYPLYLTFLYALTNKSIIITRLIKAIISAYTVVLIYRLSSRIFGNQVGRITAVFCMLMPNLIYYCGLHLKETEMLFLTALFLERADALLRNNVPRIWDVIFLLAVGVATFFFRAVLCYVLFITLAVSAVFGSKRLKAGGKWMIEILLVLLLCLLAFTQIGSDFFDADEYQDIQEQQTSAMQWRSVREGGNAYARYASASIFAPLIFTIPFPTMVNVETQQNQQMIHGGNYVKNILSFFTILALVLLLLSGRWRESIVPLAFVIGYLTVLAFSNFAQSERFHIPSLPFELMFAAYGISMFKRKHKGLFTIWLVIIFVAVIGWSWFKLRGRGL